MIRIAVISAHKGSLSWTRMLSQIEINESIYIEYFFSYSDELYRSNRTFFSHVYLRLKTYIFFPIYFIFKSKSINKNYDKVIIITSPFFLPYLSTIFLKSPELIILYNDIYPEALLEKKIIKTNSFSHKLLIQLQLFTYRNSSYSIFIGSEHYRLVKEKYNYYENFRYKIINVPSHLSSNMNDKLVTSSEVNFIYSGTIGLFHDFELFFKFLEFVQIENNFIFLFNTNGAAKTKFEKQIVSKFPYFVNSKLIRLGNPVSSNVYETLMKNSQIGIIFQDLNGGSVVFPSKFASMLVSGQAILAFMDQNCLMASIIIENDLGWVIDTSNPGYIKEVITQISDNITLLNKRNNARAYGFDNYSVSTITDSWIDVLKN
jgi:hypothetical protein